MKVFTTNDMTSLYCKDTNEAMAKIRELIQVGNPFHVVNEYETFYGVGFDSWLREGVKDLQPQIKVTSYNQWEGYPWSYDIIPA